MNLQTAHEETCLANAAYFTAVRRVNGQRERLEFPTIEEAIAEGERHGDGRTMIYAVTATGSSAHLRNC